MENMGMDFTQGQYMGGNGGGYAPPQGPTPMMGLEAQIPMTGGGGAGGGAGAAPTAATQALAGASAGASGALNPRSCILCRKRKVRCDKKEPCFNCVKGNAQCTYPSPGRAPRRARRLPDRDLNHRLQVLEKQLRQVRAQGAEAGDAQAGGGAGVAPLVPQEQPGQIGRLVTDRGASRYLSSEFWTSLTDELHELQEALDRTTDDEDDMSSPAWTGSPHPPSSHNEVLFSFSSQSTQLRQFQPSSAQIDFLWETYKINVDPLVKVLHKPTVDKEIAAAREDLDSVSKNVEALMFAIFLSATVSLPEERVQQELGESKDRALAKYRFATGQALAQANFLTEHDVVSLQAFVIYLVIAGRQDESRSTWTITGIAIRIAQSLGLQRDGEKFGLSFFETEMRRRLWWQVHILDVRSSETHGSDPSIADGSYDTNFPLNINDDAFGPETTEPVEPLRCCTEITFCLVRYEATEAMRKLNYPNGRQRKATQREKIQWIEAVSQRIKKNYLEGVDEAARPLDRLTSTVTHLILGKMWLMLYHPYQQRTRRQSSVASGGATAENNATGRAGSAAQTSRRSEDEEEDLEPLNEEQKDDLFRRAIELIHYSRLLEETEATERWGWLVKAYVQWPAIVYILAQFVERQKNDLTLRGWKEVNGAFEHWGEQVQAIKRDAPWRPIKALRMRAEQHARELGIGPDGRQSTEPPANVPPRAEAGVKAGAEIAPVTPKFVPGPGVGIKLEPLTPGATPERNDQAGYHHQQVYNQPQQQHVHMHSGLPQQYQTPVQHQQMPGAWTPTADDTPNMPNALPPSTTGPFFSDFQHQSQQQQQQQQQGFTYQYPLGMDTTSNGMTMTDLPTTQQQQQQVNGFPPGGINPHANDQNGVTGVAAAAMFDPAQADPLLGMDNMGAEFWSPYAWNEMFDGRWR